MSLHVRSGAIGDASCLAGLRRELRKSKTLSDELPAQAAGIALVNAAAQTRAAHLIRPCLDFSSENADDVVIPKVETRRIGTVCHPMEKGHGNDETQRGLQNVQLWSKCVIVRT